MSKLQKGVNDLLTWCKNNGRQGERLIQEWTGITEQAEQEYLEQLKEKELEVSNHEFDGLMDTSEPEIKRISMDEITKANNKRVKWRCRDCKHEWFTRIIHRTKGHNCPACATILSAEKKNKVIVEKNSLHTWCLQNGERGQRLIQEWTGLDENDNPISMDSIQRSSGKKVKWKCNTCNHEWLATINSRAYGTNCPACSGRVATKGFNDLHTWCLQNGERGQQLIDEWVGLDADNAIISIDFVTRASSKKVKWKCRECNHEWLATIHSRMQGNNCVICAGQVIVPGFNDLHTWCLQAGEQGERLIQEWTGITEVAEQEYLNQLEEYEETGLNRSGETEIKKINMNEIAKCSGKKVKWKCRECEYEWFTTIAHRTSNGRNCPACANILISEKNSTPIQGENDLHTWCLQNGERGQRLIQEWTGLDGDSNPVNIDSVTRASGKKVQWRCKRNHTWISTIANRTSNRHNCPYCNPNGTSYPEQLLYHSLKQIFPDTISRGTFNNYEYDIAVKSLKLCIEYSGYYYHQDKLARDTEKYNLCKKHGVHFIQIYCHQGELVNSEDLTNILHTFNYTEDGLDELGDLFTPNLIIYQQSIDHDNQLKDILSFLLNQFNHSIDEIDFDKATKDAMKFIEDTIDNECESDKSIGEYKGI